VPAFCQSVIRQCRSIHLLSWVLLSVGLAGAQDPGPGAGHYTEKELETLKRVYQEAEPMDVPYDIGCCGWLAQPCGWRSD
jgi:hypothetical protein